jgi:hypothetical protein
MEVNTTLTSIWVRETITQVTGETSTVRDGGVCANTCLKRRFISRGVSDDTETPRQGWDDVCPADEIERLTCRRMRPYRQPSGSEEQEVYSASALCAVIQARVAAIWSVVPRTTIFAGLVMAKTLRTFKSVRMPVTAAWTNCGVVLGR